MIRNTEKIIKKMMDAVKDVDSDKKRAISLVKTKIEPLERNYLNGKYTFVEFIKRINPIQEKIRKIVEIQPLLENTFRFARKGEMFATNTLMKRINNYEEPGSRKRLPDE